MTDDDFESRVLDFERAWRQSGPPEIADFLDRPSALSEHDRRRLLLELICVDLEFRWRDARPTERRTLEGDFAAFPELADAGDGAVGLVGEEYRARHRWGDRPPHEEYLRRFPAFPERLRAELHGIDAELKAEATCSRPDAPAPVKAPEEPAWDAHWLSHDDFLLRRMIGAGRFGKVYQAWQRSAGREVAVKFLRKSFLHDAHVVRRFHNEAKTIARLHHPHIVATQGLGRTPRAYFLVMELVRGPNLAELGRVRQPSWDETIRWGMETCAALEHAHSQGVIHCDLKPANLLLDGGAHIRVTDFGLARSLTDESPWAAELAGTAPFMAPEQVSRHWGPIDERTDVYGVGAVLYTLLTGRPPWGGRRLADVLADVVVGAPPPALNSLRPDIPEALSELCSKCLCKEPRSRVSSVREVREALRGIRSPVQG